MIKKLLLGMFAASLLFATSCSHDELDVVQDSDMAQVTFNLGVQNSAGTKAISDGEKALKLIYAVYDADMQLLPQLGRTEVDLQGHIVGAENAHTVSITLAKGQTYYVAFWAQDPDCDAYDTDDLKAVTVDYDGLNNDESRDAFYKTVKVQVSGNQTINVDLKRPFAQINVGVTKADWDAAVASGVTLQTSEVIIENAANQINLLDGSVKAADNEVVKVSYGASAFPALFTTPETLDVDVNNNGTIEEGEKYVYLSMSYILVADAATGAEKANLNSLKYTFKGNGKTIVFDEGLAGVPVQRNWRTNIIGKLLTGDITFNVYVDKSFDGDFNYPEYKTIADGVSYDANTKTFVLSNKKGFDWFVAKTNTPGVKSEEEVSTASGTFKGYTVKLVQNIDLSGVDFTPIGTVNTFQGTFDGCNNTISNLYVKGDKEKVGLFANVKGIVQNVSLNNVKIEGSHYAGGIVGYIYGSIINCHVNGGSITLKVKDEDNGDKAGGIAGYVGDGSYKIENNTVKNLSVVAYRDVAGLVGCSQTGVTVTGNTVDNVTVIADMLQNGGKTLKDANAGEIVGRNIGKADLSSNTTNNVAVKVYAVTDDVANVATADGLVYALEKKYDVVLEDDVKIDPAGMSNAYGTTGINVKNGQTIDGGGYTLDIKGAGGTWDSGINTTGGLIKNITVTGSFRGIFINHNSDHSEKVVLENVIIDGTVYTISCDQGTNNGFEATNSTFNGWTSYAATLGTAKFTNCKFGEGSGYAYCRPYAPTEFVGCEFEAGFKMEPIAEVKFKNCTYDGAPLTSDNIGTLVTYNEEQVKEVVWDSNSAVLNNNTLNSLNVALKSGIETIVLTKDIILDGSKGNYLNSTGKVTIKSNNGSAIKLSGIGHTGEHQVQSTYDSGNITFEGIVFDVPSIQSGWAMSSLISGTANVTFKNCTFTGVQSPIYLAGADAVVIIDNCKFNTQACAIQAEVYSGDFQLGKNLIVKNCNFGDMKDVLHIYDHDKNPSTSDIETYLKANNNTFTGTCRQTCN